MRHCLILGVLVGTTYLAETGFGDDRTIRRTSHARKAVRPLVIAHRGASGYLPEHTTEAAAYAHALGSDYIEQDVVLSKDGIPVVLHDLELDDVTNVADVFPGRRHRGGHWYAFDFTLAELRQLNVVERVKGPHSRRFPNGSGNFRIATLREHIQLIRGLDHSRETATGLYVEIKQPARHRDEGLDVSKAVLAVLDEFGFSDPEDRIFIQCFEADELRRLRTDLKCRLPLIQLLGKIPTAAEIQRHAKVVDGLGVSISCVITGRVSEASDKAVITDVVRRSHENALLVHVWTVRTDQLPEFATSTDELLKWLIQDAGADGIFTDHPDAVLRWRRELAPQARNPFRFIQE